MAHLHCDVTATVSVTDQNEYVEGEHYALHVLDEIVSDNIRSAFEDYFRAGGGVGRKVDVQVTHSLVEEATA